MHLVSIDVGLKNLGIVCLQIDVDALRAAKSNMVQNITKNFSNVDMDILQKVYNLGKITYFNKVELVERGVLKVTEITDDTLWCVTQCIQKIPRIKDEDTYVLIEIQVTKNHIAERIQNHIHSTLLNMYAELYPERRAARVHLIWSWMKMRVNGAPKGMNEYARKKWAYEKASHIIHQIDSDTHSRMYRTFAKDRADLSDAYLQAQAWLYTNAI
jgi:hypothetical protein